MYGADQTDADVATMKWLDRELLMAITGWPPGEVARLTRAQVRQTLIFRDELQRAQSKKR